MRAFASPLGFQLERFLAHKRSLGLAYHREEGFLHEFDRFLATRNDPVLCEAMTREFLSRLGDGSRLHHLTVIRQLARFLLVEESRTFVPTRRFLGIRRRRPVIRVLSRTEAGRFLDACEQLPATSSTFARGLVRATALRVLLLTGLRRGEVLALRDDDVDLVNGLITVRQGKFGKSRFVPLTPDLTERLRAYRDIVAGQVAGRRPADAFFPRSDGHHPTTPKILYKSFRQVLVMAGIDHHGRGRGPRLHDLRHSFAVLRLLRWYEADADLWAKLPLLATYLGHVGLNTSQVYLHMTRDLVGEVTRRHLARFGDLVTVEVTS